MLILSIDKSYLCSFTDIFVIYNVGIYSGFLIQLVVVRMPNLTIHTSPQVFRHSNALSRRCLQGQILRRALRALALGQQMFGGHSNIVI